MTAVDTDPDAIAAARENVALNGADAGVRLECTDFRSLEVPHADIVVANLTGELLRRAATDVASRAGAGGDIIVSGVLRSDDAAVVAAFEVAGATVCARKAEDEWLGLHFRRQRIGTWDEASAGFRRRDDG